LSPYFNIYPNLSLFYFGSEHFAGLQPPSDISGSYGEKYEQNLLWRFDSEQQKFTDTSKNVLLHLHGL
jgi:hypothetical protein